MDRLQLDFKDIHITDDKTSRTGVYYHNDMLLHFSLKEHPYRKIPHPENPSRLKSIITHLNDKNLLKRCSVCTKFNQASLDKISLAHTETYIDITEGMWPEGCGKDSLYYKDTYYNKDTPRAAGLAVEAVLECVDQVLENQLDNAFAIVRPPGHHAGADTKISGFCIYNYAAIAAKHAIKKYGLKKVLIFDWDAHFGDGTSKILYDSKEILYISLHRHDDGKFYPPGPMGGLDKIGSGEGVGYNINIGWNLPNEDYIISDNDYVYAFERLCMPILRQFDPELVIISAGFDAARGDPLGGLDLTQDAYAYLTARLMSLAKGKVVAALEGGYNLESISVASEAVLRTLLKEKMPLKCSIEERTSKEIMDDCLPCDLARSTIQNLINILKDYWPNLLEDKEALEFEKKVSENEKESLILKTPIAAAGHSNNVFIRNRRFFKIPKASEFEFYRTLFDKKKPKDDGDEFFKDLIPKYYGYTVIAGNNYILLENLLDDLPNASILDLKIGKLTYPPWQNKEKVEADLKKLENSVSKILGFRLAGAILKDSNGKICEKSQKRWYEKLQVEDISIYIEKLLRSNDSEARCPGALEYFIAYIEKLIEYFDKLGKRQFFAASVILVVDNTVKKYRAKFVDFSYPFLLKDGEKDLNLLEGLKNLYEILKKLR